MDASIWINTIDYIIAMVALIVAIKANSKINDHYEHDHINNEMESE